MGHLGLFSLGNDKLAAVDDLACRCAVYEQRLEERWPYRSEDDPAEEGEIEATRRAFSSPQSRAFYDIMIAETTASCS